MQHDDFFETVKDDSHSGLNCNWMKLSGLKRVGKIIDDGGGNDSGHVPESFESLIPANSDECAIIDLSLEEEPRDTDEPSPPLRRSERTRKMTEEGRKR